MLTKRDNSSLGCAGLAVAGTPTNGQFKTSNILHVQADGQSYVKAATDNIAQVVFPPFTIAALAAAAIGASKTLLLWIHMRVSDGALFMEPASKAGALFAPAGATGSGYVPGVFEPPQETRGYVLIGAIKIVTNASGAYTPGTTSLAAANQTVTYYNFGSDYGVPIPY